MARHTKTVPARTGDDAAGGVDERAARPEQRRRDVQQLALVVRR